MSLFTDKAPWIMSKLMADFGLDELSAAAIVGNLGHESGGFKFLQELKPMVPGSRGGYGWAQWTGPRRRAFEAYCARNSLDPKSDKANYAFLFVELTGSEKAAITAVKKATTLESKVIAFEAKFERAGVKHYASRVGWADKALAAYRQRPPAMPDHDQPVIVPAEPVKPLPDPGTIIPDPPRQPDDPGPEPDQPAIPADFSTPYAIGAAIAVGLIILGLLIL